MEVRVGGEKERVHVENTAERRARDAERDEAVFDGLESLERR